MFGGFSIIVPFWWSFLFFLQDTILGCFGFSLQRMMTGDPSRFKQIFVFDAGQVVEKGPPEELLIKVTGGKNCWFLVGNHGNYLLMATRNPAKSPVEGGEGSWNQNPIIYKVFGRYPRWLALRFLPSSTVSSGARPKGAICIGAIRSDLHQTLATTFPAFEACSGLKANWLVM